MRLHQTRGSQWVLRRWPRQRQRERRRDLTWGWKGRSFPCSVLLHHIKHHFMTAAFTETTFLEGLKRLELCSCFLLEGPLFKSPQSAAILVLYTTDTYTQQYSHFLLEPSLTVTTGRAQITCSLITLAISIWYYFFEAPSTGIQNAYFRFWL